MRLEDWRRLFLRHVELQHRRHYRHDQPHDQRHPLPRIPRLRLPYPLLLSCVAACRGSSDLSEKSNLSDLSCSRASSPEPKRGTRGFSTTRRGAKRSRGNRHLPYSAQQAREAHAVAPSSLKVQPPISTESHNFHLLQLVNCQREFGRRAVFITVDRGFFALGFDCSYIISHKFNKFMQR